MSPSTSIPVAGVRKEISEECQSHAENPNRDGKHVEDLPGTYRNKYTEGGNKGEESRGECRFGRAIRRRILRDSCNNKIKKKLKKRKKEKHVREEERNGGRIAGDCSLENDDVWLRSHPRRLEHQLG